MQARKFVAAMVQLTFSRWLRAKLSFGQRVVVELEKIMSASLEIVEAQALKLAPADRSHLLARLISSLDFDAELQAAWGQKRIDGKIR